MNGDMTARWSKVPAWSSTLDRRDLLVLGAGAAAGLFLAQSQTLRRSITRGAALPPAQMVRSFPKSRWGWTVELAVLDRLETDRTAALTLLWAALELDLERAPLRGAKPALRLYDLYAAAAEPAGRTALAALVRARSSEPALLARASLWSDASRAPHPRLWRTVSPDRRPLGIYLARA